MKNYISNYLNIWTTALSVKSNGRSVGIDNQKHYGIEKLRELILELAVRGKLVPQDPNDEPASVLLDRIAQGKERKTKNNYILKGGMQNEAPFTLPVGWNLVKLGDIGITNIGLTYSPKDIDTKGTPVLRSSNILNGKIILSDLVRVNKGLSEKIQVNEGDLLICARNGSKKLVGKCAIIGNLSEHMAFGAFMAIFRSDFNNYIKCFLESPIYRNRLEGFETTTINQITQDNLKNTFLPLPPPSEQHRIVARVDELMALCDQLEKEQTENNRTQQALVEALLKALTNSADHKEFQSTWQRIIEVFDTLFTTEYSIEQLKQTILQLAVMGKLVPQDPDDEPASVLLERIAKEKERLVKEGKIRKEEKLKKISDEEIPYKLPMGWTCSRLNDIIDVRDGTHDTPKEAFGNKTYPLITSKHFHNGNILFDEARLISEEDHIEISKRSFVEKYDILFSMIGGNLGNQVMVLDDRPFSIKNLALFKYYNRILTDPFFIKRITEYIAFDLQSNATGGAQPFVSLGYLRNMTIGLPPVNEQQRIVTKINELFTLCDTLKESIGKSQKIKVQLADAVVEHALN